MMTSDAFEGPSPRDNQRLLESVRNRIGEVTRVIVQGRNQDKNTENSLRIGKQDQRKRNEVDPSHS